MKIGIGNQLINLATLPGPSRPGGIVVPIVVGPFPSTRPTEKVEEACSLEVGENSYFKQLPEERVKIGDFIYEDSEAKTLLRPGVYQIVEKQYFQIGGSPGEVISIGNCPQPIEKFDSTIKPVEKIQVCETAYEGTFLFKEGSSLELPKRGAIIYVNPEGTERAEEGYYKTFFEASSYYYEVKRFGVVGDVEPCEL